MRMLRGKERSKEPELEEIDLESLELEAVAEAPDPVFAPVTPSAPPPRSGEAWSRARESLVAIQRDLEALAAANEAAVHSAEARAVEVGRENEELRARLQEADRRIAELEAFKRNLKQILDG